MEQLILAGKITSQAREYGKKLIKPGVSVLEVSQKVEDKIRDLGGGLSFPAQLNRNNIAAHYCAKHKDDNTFEEGDMVKLDCGAHIEGFVTDSAATVYLGSDPELKKLQNVSLKALNNVIKMVKPGVLTSQVGRVIEDTITAEGFKPVRNLSGHGIGQYVVHQAPNIPNFDTGDKTILKEGHTFACEPFATNGAGAIYEKGAIEIFMQISNKNVRNIFARKVLAEIKKFEGLPFAKRWLVQKFDAFKVSVAMKELLAAGVLKGYGPLLERGNGIVSQHEHSFWLRDGKAIVLTK